MEPKSDVFQKGPALQLVVDYVPDMAERCIPYARPDSITINLAAFDMLAPHLSESQMRETVTVAKSHAAKDGKHLIANPSAQLVNDRLLQSDQVRPGDIEHIRLLLSFYIAATKEFRDVSEIRNLYPGFDIGRQECVLRYGNVELRVVENFLRDPEGLQNALFKILPSLNDDVILYSPSRASHFLAADDVDWNLRTLMTNAGFYSPQNKREAWENLTEWCDRYIAALRCAWLAAYPNAYPFYFAIQNILRDKFAEVPRYVKHPSVVDFYRGLSGKSVLLVSPLAHLAVSQYESGRIWNLFKEFQPKPFRLAGLGTWISTWPNRPHSGWSETFGKMCEAIDAQYKAESFDVFVSSCGSYGLPIAEHVRKKFGCQVIYLGNITHAFFGIRQTATKNFMKDRINAELWVEGDLGRFANLDRIDGGRYV